MGGPHFAQVQSKHSFPLYGLPPNYEPPNVVHVPDENIDHYAPIPLESQQPQSGHAHVAQPMGETHEVLADFEPYPGYATEGQAFGGIPQPNTLGGLQYCPQPQPQPLHFSVGRVPPAMVEREKYDHLEERLKAIEGGGDYPFVDMAELCLVPDIIIPPKFKVLDFDKYKGTTCPKNHLKMYYRKMGSYTKDKKLLMHFFQESLVGVGITWYTNLESSRSVLGKT